jgi:hypothetical protein
MIGGIRGALLVGLLAWCLPLNEARGQSRDPAAAETLFREGRALMASAMYREACPKFDESFRLDPAPGTLLNLADCEERTGRLATAWAHYHELATELRPHDERLAIAVHRAALLEPRLPRITIGPSSRLSSELHVWRDDVELGSASFAVPLPVDPGTHTVRVYRGDRPFLRTSFALREGDSKRIDLASVDLLDPSEGHTAMRTVGWGLSGLAVASLLTCGAFGIAAFVNNDATDGQCANGVCATPASAEAYDTARTEVRVAEVGLGVGLAAAVSAVALLVASSSPPPAELHLRPLARFTPGGFLF